MIMLINVLCDSVYFVFRLLNSDNRIGCGHAIDLSFFLLFIKERPFPNTDINVHSQGRQVRLGSRRVYLGFSVEYLEVRVNVPISHCLILTLDHSLLSFLFLHLCSSGISLIFNLFHLGDNIGFLLHQRSS